MSVADRLGLVRRVVTRIDDVWRVHVVMPMASHPGNHVDLTEDQYKRYVQWTVTGVLIQDILPDLSDEQREILMSGGVVK